MIDEIIVETEVDKYGNEVRIDERNQIVEEAMEGE